MDVFNICNVKPCLHSSFHCTCRFISCPVLRNVHVAVTVVASHEIISMHSETRVGIFCRRALAHSRSTTNIVWTTSRCATSTSKALGFMSWGAGAARSGHRESVYVFFFERKKTRYATRDHVGFSRMRVEKFRHCALGGIEGEGPDGMGGRTGGGEGENKPAPCLVKVSL